MLAKGTAGQTDVICEQKKSLNSVKLLKHVCHFVAMQCYWNKNTASLLTLLLWQCKCLH